MTNNSTVLSRENPGWRVPWFSLTMLVQGLVIGGSNFFIVLVVLRFKALRSTKEYLVVLCLSVADGIDMMGNITAGARRSYLSFIGNHILLRTPWECTLVSHNLIWLFSGPLSGLILLTISVDRLLSVTFPLRYIAWSNMYIAIVFGFTFTYPLINLVMGLILAYDVRNETSNIKGPNECYSFFGMVGINDYYVSHYQYSGVLFATASVAAYVLVWLKYRQHQNKVGPGTRNNHQKIRQLIRQRNLTKNLGISSLCTVFVYIIPYGLANIIMDHFLHIFPISVVSFLFLFTNFNSLCNVFIYYKRQPEMKQAFKAFFTGKAMPNNLSLWKANTAALNSVKRLTEQRNLAPTFTLHRHLASAFRI